MAPNDANAFDKPEESLNKINTFAVIDLETCNLPALNYNRTSITELCIYAFDSGILKDNVADGDAPQILEAPRVIHKLNLLFQPTMMVHPDAERLTGLNNYILERESRLNENSAQMIINFVRHLPGRICLVAHNGWSFDFPIVRQAFEKLSLSFPEDMLCVDSLRAFIEIDDKRYIENNLLKVPVTRPLKINQEEQAQVVEIKVEPVCQQDHVQELEIKVEPSSQPVKEINWRQVNETTPKRPILTPTEAASKRRKLNNTNPDEDEDSDDEAPIKRDFRSRRQLFKGLKCANRKRIPPRGKYKLDNLFERTFNQPAENAHRAEADVAMVTQLIQHYGTDFLAFAEEQAIPFLEVTPLGSPSKKPKLGT
ncbi:uncharacterized protein Dwil_GK24851 [Drosophila willistoni]|uniref:Exonuclease domain-containing protein n=1 Tax=Drosophila willistoni TaxID=7260 RepID=B4N101_DROWI|nr:uncharacterized protein LOC6644082 [Drosophila willistoni]EDW78163.1 uncharacterized protein Dwil_GK24851 [Drosophila willistoni]